MKQLFLLTLGLCATWALVAQDLPRKSQSASVEQRIGLTWTIVSYARPAVKGRTIWGDLVPYGKVWRTGANEPTLLILDDEVEIEGVKVAPGQYALFTIPEQDRLTFILNTDTNQWGSFNYNEKYNVHQFEAKPRKVAFHEYLTFSFKESTVNTANLCLSWADQEYCFKIQTDVKDKALKSIEEAIAYGGDRDHSIYLRSIYYAIESGDFMDKAVGWAENALKVSNNAHDALWAKAMLLGAMKNYKKAIETGMRSAETLRLKEPNSELLKNYEANIETWKKLQP